MFVCFTFSQKQSYLKMKYFSFCQILSDFVRFCWLHYAWYYLKIKHNNRVLIFHSIISFFFFFNYLQNYFFLLILYLYQQCKLQLIYSYKLFTCKTHIKLVISTYIPIFCLQFQLFLNMSQKYNNLAFANKSVIIIVYI